MMKTIGALASLCFLGLWAPQAFADGPRDISNCGAIAKSGSYALTRNLSATGTCLTINADNVTIDFDGFVMSGDGTGAGIQGGLGHAGLTVRNGTITNFGVGIALLPTGSVDVPGSIVERMRIINITNFGIGGMSGIVRDSVFTGNGNTSIALGNGASIVTGNRVVGNQRAGISVQSGSTVSGNVVQNSGTIGISVACPSLVIGNTSTDNGANLLLTGAGCTVDHNVAP